ncbi:17-beta-hydroxysteroid dehydrogenase type 2 isoform X1 [Phascolarctos cinereus]|uniref:Estradiol 17-beta-dehydrogenase 2 isoform X1 n=1 Tax=Phascolarctos cinereus TaxID=38626 RepID=A0A6P5KRP3_PHACI|nr:estradiol 17-beta-dehydrogenase 2 isoform X1 [Phascolarctos cinereus]
MTLFSWEAGLLPLGVTMVLGGTALYKFKKSQSRTVSSAAVLCHLALLCLWGAYCFSSLSVFWGWTLFSLACCISLAYSTSQEMLPVDGRAVLITGGDSGIGHALSKYLDELGFTVFVGVLNEKGPGAEALKKSCSKRTSVFQMDVTNPAQIKEVQARIAEKVQHTGLWAVINNAGVLGTIGDGELLPMNIYRQCMDVNFFGAVEVTKAFLPLLRKSRGRFINMSSMAGIIPLKQFVAYSSSKAALTMFSGVMRLELKKWGIKVALIHPAAFKTNIGGTNEMWVKQEKDVLENTSPDVLDDYGQDYLRSSTWGLLQNFSKSPPDFSPLFTDVLHGILCKNPSALYTAGIFSYLWICLFSYFPVSVFDYVVNKIFRINPLPKALR